MSREPHRLIGELRERRLAAGLSARAVSRAAGLAEGTVAAWESRRYEPTVSGLEQYLAVFGMGLIASDVATRHEEAMRRLDLEAMPGRPSAADQDDELQPITPEMAAGHRSALAKALGFTDDLPQPEFRPAPVREAA